MICIRSTKSYILHYISYILKGCIIHFKGLYNDAPSLKDPHKIMARYTGPKTKTSRRFGEPITGNGKWLTKNSNPPGMHGDKKKRKTLGEYALQLKEKQKAKYTYGLLE